MTPELLSAFTLFALISSITPGPNNLMLMASGTNFGFARTVPHALGVTAGFIVMVLLVGIGLAQLFEAYPVVHDVLKVLCALYLVYLAWKIANAAPPEEGAVRGAPMSFTQAALFQWVNPKAWTMALTAVSTYAPEHAPLQTLGVIAIIFGIINLPCTSVWTLAGVQLRRLLQQPRALRVFNVGAALALVASLVPAFVSSAA